MSKKVVTRLAISASLEGHRPHMGHAFSLMFNLAFSAERNGKAFSLIDACEMRSFFGRDKVIGDLFSDMTSMSMANSNVKMPIIIVSHETFPLIINLHKQGGLISYDDNTDEIKHAEMMAATDAFIGTTHILRGREFSADYHGHDTMVIEYEKLHLKNLNNLIDHEIEIDYLPVVISNANKLSKSKNFENISVMKPILGGRLPINWHALISMYHGVVIHPEDCAKFHFNWDEVFSREEIFWDEEIMDKILEKFHATNEHKYSPLPEYITKYNSQSCQS